jgi:hypothetical protein
MLLGKGLLRALSAYAILPAPSGGLLSSEYACLTEVTLIKAPTVVQVNFQVHQCTPPRDGSVGA